MIEQIEYRRVALEDLPQIIRIANQAFVEMGRLPARFGKRALEHLKDFPEWQFLAASGGKVLGFIFGSPQNEEDFVMPINWIATDPALQGRGIGGSLLRAYERHCRKLGCQRIYIRTPFAARFYEKYGYRPIGASYRLIKELMGKSIPDPGVENFRILDLEDIPTVLENLPPSEHFPFLEALFTVYEEEQDKALLCIRRGSLRWLLICRGDPYEFDLIHTLFFHTRSRSDLKELLSVFEYRCSKKGKRWAGFVPRTNGEKQLAEERGWRESHLPSFWVMYRLEKVLV
jgi:GNAT superfamily N-acetyltransferase